MAEFLLMILYTISAVVVLGYALAEVFLFGRLNLKTYSLINLAVIYFLAPLFVLSTGVGVSTNFIPHNFPARIDLFILFIPVSWLAVISFTLAYSVAFRFKYDIQFSMPSPILFVFFLVLIGVVCWSIFIELYGGLKYVTNNVSKIRSGIDENKNYLGAFFRIFADYLVFATFFSFSHYCAKTRWMLPIFLIVLSLASAKLFLDGGRGGLINLFIGLYFISVQSSRKINLLIFSILIGASYYVGVYGKIFIFALLSDIPYEILLRNAAGAVGGLDSVFAEYSHQFLSTFIAMDNSSLISDRYGLDLVAWALKPLKLVGISVPDSISFHNTYLITGRWDSEVPPGIIALGFYNFGVFFCWIPIFLWGVLCRSVDNSFRASVYKADPNVRAMYAILFVFLPFGLMNSDPALFFQWLIGVFSLVFFLKFFRFYKRRPRGGAG